MDSSPSNASKRNLSPPVTIPKASFRLKMARTDKSGVETLRWAIYDPYSSHLIWEDNGEKVVKESEPKVAENFGFQPNSPSTPGHKSHHMKLVKIQVGFGCNYSCGYCSQKAFRPAYTSTSEKELQTFLTSFEKQYDGGEDGKGQGTRIDFIGGETLLYWKNVKSIATQIKAKYPNIKFSLYTNGSVVIDELADEAIRFNLLVMLSHDGLDQKKNRGKDPFEKKESRDFLQRLAAKLIPNNLFIVQMTLGKSNFALGENRALLSKELGQPPHLLPLAYDIVHAFEENAKALIPAGDEEMTLFQARVLREFRTLSWSQSLAFTNFRMDLVGLIDPLVGRTGMGEYYQRCEMDKPTSIALDLRGNVLTCQNTTAQSGHKIGELDKFDEIRLTTGLHWSYRKNCRNCPVVAMCRGACMYTKDQEFQKTCDSMFSYYLSVLAHALENMVGWRLLEIQGDNIRTRGVSTIHIK